MKTGRSSSTIIFKQRAQKTPQKTKKILGMEIDRKTNVLSLAAFMLSISGIASQIYFFLQGPKVALQPPEQATIFSEPSSDGKSSYIKIAARMAYVNTGQPGFNDAIKREAATLSIGDEQYHFYWKKYVSTDADGTKFIKNTRGDALPVPINAGSVEAHETAFSPDINQEPNKPYDSNFIQSEAFLKLIEKQKSIVLTVRFETFSGTKGVAKCKIIIDRPLLLAFKNGWAAPGCA
jgi:hypothetical protein